MQLFLEETEYISFCLSSGETNNEEILKLFLKEEVRIESGMEKKFLSLKNGTKHGKETIVSLKSGNLIKETFWNFGIFVKETCWDDEGRRVCERQTLENGKIYGKKTTRHNGGKKNTEIESLDGLKHGQVSAWHYFSGNLKTVEEWENGQRQGLKVDYFPNGKIKSICTFENGKIHGTAYFFEISGKSIKINYKNGLSSSESRNGRLSFIPKERKISKFFKP